MNVDNPSRIEAMCLDRGMKMTEQRRIIARVLSDATDHPDTEEVHRRAMVDDANISIATVYRTLRIFEQAGILERVDFGDGRARYEEASSDHHDHLIDINTGHVIEFHNAAIEALQEKIASEYGYKLVGHKLELYGIPIRAHAEPDDNDDNPGQDADGE